MAPPPHASLPMVQRLRKLAQTLQFAWFAGHLTLIICVLRYFLGYLTFDFYSLMPQLSYRFAFVAAAATYGIVVYKAHFARGPPNGRPIAIFFKLLGDENVQYLIMALVWLISRQIPLALLPFTIYSTFHVATYSRNYLVPTIQPPRLGADGRAIQPPLVDSIGRFVKQYYDASMGLVAALELALIFRLLLSVLTFSTGALALFVAYLTFFRARYSQSSFVQHIVALSVARVDAAVSHQGTPPAARQVWTVAKASVSRIYYTTDVSRYTGRFTQSPGKKAQ